MGNSLTTDSKNSNTKFNNSQLANTIKDIMTNYTVNYQNSTVKLHLAKACCNGSVSNVIPNANVVSIPFPDIVGNCSSGSCIKTVYVGYQINGDPKEICTEKNIGFPLIGRGAGDKTNSTCDNFMIDYCAKSLYDQGCIKMKPNKKNIKVPSFPKYNENRTCWKDPNRVNYGPPECYCLNSIFGPVLNTNPTRTGTFDWPDADNPYGIPIDELNDTVAYSKYTVDMYHIDPTQQYPTVLDTVCATKQYDRNTTASAYTLGKDADPTVTICMNQINFNDSNIGNANLNDIKQNNNCGTPPQATTAPGSTPPVTNTS